MGSRDSPSTQGIPRSKANCRPPRGTVADAAPYDSAIRRNHLARAHHNFLMTMCLIALVEVAQVLHNARACSSADIRRHLNIRPALRSKNSRRPRWTSFVLLVVSAGALGGGGPAIIQKKFHSTFFMTFGQLFVSRLSATFMPS